MKRRAIDLYLQQLKEGIQHETIEHTIHHADMADYLESVSREDKNTFFEQFNLLPLSNKAETFLELLATLQKDLIEEMDALSLAELIGVLKSDDATDVFLFITKIDKVKAENIFVLLSDEQQDEIDQLTHYDDHEAGSLMQTELLKVSLNQTIEEALEKLSNLKANGIGRIESLFVTDEHNKLLKNIFMDDLILENSQDKFSDFMHKFPNPEVIGGHESIDTLLIMIEKYDLSVLGVVDRRGNLIGRITHDDVVDSMQEKATQQIYNLHNLHADEEIQESFAKTSRTRAIWLTINLFNAILASLVIGVFEETLHQIVALAVLMPIVANMAGTASMQTVTVIVRQLALGEIRFSDVQRILIKEITIGMLNGLFLGILTAGISQFRFHDGLISLSIGLSMFISFIFAGILGASIPLLLKKVHIDPAVASSVLVLTFTDIIGFFSFLWLAEWIILKGV